MALNVECARCAARFVPATLPPARSFTGAADTPYGRGRETASVALRCPGCGSTYSVPSDKVEDGRAVICPGCKLRLWPAASGTGPDGLEMAAGRLFERIGKRPTAVAVLALVAVLLIWIPAGLARGPRWNGSPATYDSYRYYKKAHRRLERALGTDPSVVFVPLFVLSWVVSLALVVTSFCLWGRHGTPGRVMTVLSGALLLPCTCLGLW